MLTATITYSSDYFQFRRLVVEMAVVDSALVSNPGLTATFKLSNSESGKLETVCAGLLRQYPAWSESAVALTLRSVFAFYTQWYSSVPVELMKSSVATMQIVIAYSRTGAIDDFVPLTSVSLTREPGGLKTYNIARNADANAAWPIEIPVSSAVPLGISLKMLAFENSALMDFEEYPLPLRLNPHIAADGRKVISWRDVPDYARDAFNIFRQGVAPLVGPADHSDEPIPFGDWLAFLKT